MAKVLFPSITKSLILAMASIFCFTFTSCHTTEENYKASYDIAADKAKKGIGNDVYDKIQAEQNKATDIINGDSVRMLHRAVGFVDVEKKDVKRFNVVVRQFKQRTNARSMRDRLIAEGLQSCVLFYTPDKDYYVVAQGFDTKEEAAAFIKTADKKIKMKLPLDKIWILVRIN